MNGKLIVVTVMLAVLSLQTGCFSYMAMEHGKKQVALRRAVIKNDPVAIKAVQLGDNGVGVGIDITNWEALTENPLLQLGAAVLDAGLVYAGYAGVKSFNDSGSGGQSSTTVGGDQMVIQGNNNSVNMGNSSEATGTDSGANQNQTK